MRHLRKVLGKRKRRETAGKLASLATSRYGELNRRKIRPPLDQLILSVLWRHTSTRQATRALRKLKSAFVDWNETRVSPVAEIASVMSTADWAAPSAERIAEVLQGLFEARNVVALDFLSELTLTQARTFLQSLPGLRRDLANEVLLFSLKANVFPLSQDMARMCFRLGLIPTDRATLQNQRQLMELWEPGLYVCLTLFFADHTKSVCRLDRCHQKDCKMRTLCPRTGA